MGIWDVVYIFDDDCTGAEGELKFEIDYFPLVGTLFYFRKSSKKTSLFAHYCY